MTTSQAIEKVIATAKAEVGYLEKKSNSMLDNKTANAGYNNYTKYWRDIADWGMGNYQSQYWCAAFLYWCFVKTFGHDKAKKLLLHEPYISCANAGTLFKKEGRLYDEPKVGDIVLFMKSSGTFGHTGLVYKVADGCFYTIEGNTSTTAGVVSNGGAVACKTYSISASRVAGHKFARPDYSLVATSKSKSTPASAAGALNKTVKWIGYINADKVNVRTYAGKENSLCSFSPLKKNAKVSVCDSVKASGGATWHYISYNGKFGFVRAKYVDKRPVSNPKTGQTTKKVADAEKYDKKIAGTYKVSASSGLNMRYNPGKLTDSNIIAAIPGGANVQCYGYYTAINGINWYLIMYNQMTGYVSCKYLKKQ